MIIKNYTPHAVNVMNENNELMYTFESVGNVRVGEKNTVVGSVNGIPTIKTEFTEIEGLPAEETGIVLIVSMLVKSATNRTDLISPG